MNLLPLIAALAAAYLQEPSVPSRTAGPVVQALAAAQVPEELRADVQAAVRWFVESVAKPLLASRDTDQLVSILAERRDVAAQARMAIAHAVNAVLAAAPPARDDIEVDPELVAQLEARATSEAALVSLLLQVATVDFADFYTFMRDREPLGAEERQVAMTHLVPLATQAEVWLLVALVGVHAEPRPTSAVLDFVVEAADVSFLRYRAALHATLRSWDPSWVPSIDAPEWADAPVPLALTDAEIANVVSIFRAPPAPTDALRRALSRR